MRASKRPFGPGGHVVIGTFAPDGPERCSGLPIMRYDANAPAAVVGTEFTLVDCLRHDHLTPGGNTQHFQFSILQRN